MSQSAVIAHMHDRIIFELPEGTGQKEIQVSVGGRYLSVGDTANHPRILYAPPTIDVIEPLRPMNGPTVGGFSLTVRGSNFGPKQRNTSIPRLTLDLAQGRFVSPLPLAEASAVPTSYLAVDFYQSCLTDARTPQGIRPQTGRTSGC